MMTDYWESIEAMVAGGSPNYKSFDERLKEMSPMDRDFAIIISNKTRNAKYVPQDWSKIT